jgi:hypothetical protein
MMSSHFGDVKRCDRRSGAEFPALANRITLPTETPQVEC